MQGTVILHVQFAVKQDQSLGASILKQVKAGSLALGRFSFALLLSLARIGERFHDPVISYLSASFREAFAKRRAIAFADGFYELQRLGEGPKAPKQAFAVGMADGAPMPLAALWEGWRGKDGDIIRSYTTDH